jgi:hypothetical protein
VTEAEELASGGGFLHILGRFQGFRQFAPFPGPFCAIWTEQSKKVVCWPRSMRLSAYKVFAVFSLSLRIIPNTSLSFEYIVVLTSNQVHVVFDLLKTNRKRGR